MRYLNYILIYCISALLFFIFNFYDNGWQFLQPFLVVILLIYFNSDNIWLHYIFAMSAGFFVDSFTGIFGLHAIIFVVIIFLLKNLQLTLFTSKNFLSVVLLTVFSFIIYWLFFWLNDFMFHINIYIFNSSQFFLIFKTFLVNFAAVIVLHLIYYNFFLRHYDQKQSF